jgi:hypothetical protein
VDTRISSHIENLRNTRKLRKANMFYHIVMENIKIKESLLTYKALIFNLPEKASAEILEQSMGARN